MPLSCICLSCVGCLVAMLDGICPGIDRGLYASLVDGMDSDLEVLAVRFFNNRPKFRNREIFISRNLDHVDVLELVLPDCLTRAVRSVNYYDLLLTDRGGQTGLRVLNVVT